MACSNCNSCCNECCQELPTGLGACEALNKYNNEEIKPLICMARVIDPCKHLLGFLSSSIQKIHCLLGNIINNLCAIWDILLDNDGYVTVTKTYSHVVPKEKFGPIEYNLNWRWSGSPEGNESFISIPVAEMDIVDVVIAQVQVVGQRVIPVTVAIQENYREGDNYIVNFDTYLLGDNSLPETGYPYDVPIEFVVVGRKSVSNYTNLKKIAPN